MEQREQTDPQIESFIDEFGVRERTGTDVEQDKRQRKETVYAGYQVLETNSRYGESVQADGDDAEEEIVGPQPRKSRIAPVGRHCIPNGLHDVICQHQREHEEERQERR